MFSINMEYTFPFLEDKQNQNTTNRQTVHRIKIVGFFFSYQVVKQCCGTDGVEANYIKTEILPPFFKHFWQHRMALDRRNYRQVFSQWNFFVGSRTKFVLGCSFRLDALFCVLYVLCVNCAWNSGLETVQSGLSHQALYL